MTSDAVNAYKRDKSDEGRQLSPEQAAAAAMVAEARQRGLELTGPDGLLKLFTKNVLETALNEELTEHLGYDKHRAGPGRPSVNVRNGARSKTVISDAAGEVRIDVPRDRDGTFGPQIVKKRQRRLTDVDEIVLSLYAKGLTTGEISAHFAEIYGASISRETVSRITEKVVAEMAEWATRPLDTVYVAVFIDAIMVKVRDGQVANRPVYAAIGVTVEGCKDVLGLWAGTGGEGARFWMSVLTDLKNRGVKDVFFVVCDGLKGLPEVVGNVWPLAIVQTCIIHLIRNTFRLTSRRDSDAIKRDIRPIYTAPNADAASAALDELENKWGDKYAAMIRLWQWLRSPRPGSHQPAGQGLAERHHDPHASARIQHVAGLAPFQVSAQARVRAIHLIANDPGGRAARVQRTGDHAPGQPGLGREYRVPRDARRGAPGRISRP